MPTYSSVHVSAIISQPPIKAGGYEEIYDFHDVLVKQLSGLHDIGQYDAGAILTSIAALQLNARFHKQWLTFSQDHKVAPDIKIFIDFLKEKMATTILISTSQAKPFCHDSKLAKPTICQANATDTSNTCKG